ncbi:MAG: bifunctional riboflavin kinase/FAD synthetase [Actinomycetota bacterium]|nr:bifunctional riboflavin kinase/FAD synthetase [Actinomycetota bacterium]PLS76341.1 MAG: bifunctional riboflavin kinase/FAD synthetase [Actinomycetota bacterium]
MEVITDLDACPRPEAGAVVTIGAYDGVHLGHQALLARVRAMATELGCASAVVTFDRHPASVVRPESAPLLLTDLDQRLELLAAAGVDHTVVVRFDQERSREPAEDFVTEVLVGCLRARAVVVGHDFHFGHRRRGNVVLLQEMGGRLGFDVLGVSLHRGGAGDEPVSSTRVRQLLGAGRVEEAATLLGRPHEVRGLVVRGDGRGRQLGYPTANVEVPPGILLPGDGIYAGWYQRPSGASHLSAISVGRRPTFHPDAAAPMLEAHLLDFDDDLYGEPARVRFTSWLRAEERFDSADALIVQIGHDAEAARRLHAAERAE